MFSAIKKRILNNYSKHLLLTSSGFFLDAEPATVPYQHIDISLGDFQILNYLGGWSRWGWLHPRAQGRAFIANWLSPCFCCSGQFQRGPVNTPSPQHHLSRWVRRFWDKHPHSQMESDGNVSFQQLLNIVALACEVWNSCRSGVI